MTGLDIFFDKEGIVGTVTSSLIGELDSTKRRMIATGLKSWLRNEARKKNRDDLPLLLDEFCNRIDKMSEGIGIKTVDKKLVVTASGSSQNTLRALEIGTNWFDPCASVVSVMISSLWKS